MPQNTVPDSKVHGANMGPTWGQQDPGGSHVGHMNLAIRGGMKALVLTWDFFNLWLSKVLACQRCLRSIYIAEQAELSTNEKRPYILPMIEQCLDLWEKMLNM